MFLHCSILPIRTVITLTALLITISDLFKQAIQLSGSVFAEYSMSNYVIEESRKLADVVGCKMTDSHKLRDCMKERTAEELLDGVAKIVRKLVE